MKKNQNKGFMLIETLLVSTFVLGVLTYLFVQFSALKRSYSDDFKYDTVPGLYAVKNINQYIMKQNGYNALKTELGQPGYELGYLEFSCAYISGTTCSDLLMNVAAEKVYFVRDNVFKNNIDVNVPIFASDDELYRFCKRINFGENDNSYHLIVKYTDNTYATMAITL